MAFPNPNCEAGLEILVREQRKAEARSLLADELSAKDAEIERLKAALWRQQDEICQTLGKALDYPQYPESWPNVCVGEHVAESLASEAADTINRLKAELEKKKSCGYVSPYHGDRCVDGRVESPNAQFTRPCPECSELGMAKKEIDRLKAELEACEASHDDEEAAHQETLSTLDKCKADLALLKKEEHQLVELWRSPAFHHEGQEGDHKNWSPIQTAVVVLKRQFADNNRLKSELAALQNEHSDACFGLTKQLNEKDAEIANLKAENERITKLWTQTMNQQAEEIARLRAEPSARPSLPKMEWVQEKNGNGNSIWTCVVDGVARYKLFASLRNDAVAWDWPGGKLRDCTNFAACKEDVEASLKPPSVRRWVERNKLNEDVMAIRGERPVFNGNVFNGSIEGYITISVAAAIGIDLQPGECVLYDFTERRVVEVWKP